MIQSDRLGFNGIQLLLGCFKVQVVALKLFNYSWCCWFPYKHIVKRLIGFLWKNKMLMTFCCRLWVPSELTISNMFLGSQRPTSVEQQHHKCKWKHINCSIQSIVPYVHLESRARHQGTINLISLVNARFIRDRTVVCVGMTGSPV